ncbi:RNA polymerase subunit sigma-70 [Pedobacter ginsengisoli]|uniref:RNA polymerase subunit sigma-70 n=1 Tax=Pedobacter ginsengisoli TaxID=363852 RepID=A0A2D1U331_9SPHI|nr:sigma-70 family RNA polymerase sigma factor [Pedobacter ginsengisoli]ATP56016.1 RNA polymerase subunit sigma-70 [Pedobacter ginsengisoli]
MREQSFVQLIHEHQGIIHKICRLYRDSKEDREDLFQEIAYQLWKSFASYKGEAKISTWMYRIALNTAIASFRKKKLNVEYRPELPELPYFEESDEYQIRQERLFAVLKQLNESEKAIITLYLDELSYKQIAEIIGINENNLGVKLNRIKLKIQKLIIR